MNIVFMGTPEYAVPTLEALIEAGHKVKAVYTQPDRQNRNKIIVPEVKQAALAHGIEVLQPTNLRSEESIEKYRSFAPDMTIVVAYGRILPKEFLTIPKYGAINGHASLLPKYRGAGPIQWALLEGEAKTGVTAMYISEGLDEGDIIFKEELPILDSDNAESLHHKLSRLTADLMVRTVAYAEEHDGKFEVTQQCDCYEKPCFAPMLTKDMGHLDFDVTASEIHNMVRGLTPWPSAKFMFLGDWVKLFSTKVLEDMDAGNAPDGEILDDERLIIAAADNSVIELLELQVAGRKPVTGTEFMRGYRLKKGDNLKEMGDSELE